MDSSEQMNSITYMHPDLYKAAQEGNIHPFENYQNRLHQLLTPNENTLLHVYLSNQIREPISTDFVDAILKICPPLLLQANKKGETPLHLAARYGLYNVVKVLIDRAKALPTDPVSEVTGAKRMLRMTNGELDTALHEAARNRQSDVVKILIEEDRDFSYSANIHGETPLYIAVSIGRKCREREKVIDEILSNCNSVVDYGGPDGKTALHAASRNGDDATARKLLEKEEDLTQITDQNGWSPLHYAAYFRFSPFDNISVVKVLLKFDSSAACIVDTEKRTALHIAAIRRSIKVMKEIVSHCPACCEQVDNRGWNALHYAVASKRKTVINHCLKIPEFVRLKTDKDDKGNTPFHLIAALALKNKHWRHFFLGDIVGESEKYGLNMQKRSVKDISEGNFAEIQKEILESLEDVSSGRLEKNNEKSKAKESHIVVEKKASSGNDEDDYPLDKARESHLVVAALIATVTFAAAFTLPGGYKNEEGPNQGTAILSKNAAFIVFVTSDAIAMVLSMFAVFIHFMMALILGLDKYKEFDEEMTVKLFMWATLLTMIAMGSMVIAFITGTYAVLVPSLGLAISTCSIGLSFFFLVYLLYRIIENYFKYKVISMTEILSDYNLDLVKFLSWK